MSTGIDCSFWNGSFNWTKAVNQGIEFAFIKASQGVYVDSKFKENSKTCPLKYKAGYHFLDYTLKNYVKGNEIAWGQQQARYFVSTVGDWNTIPDALDMETNGSWEKIDQYTKDRVLKIALAFVGEYYKLRGYYPFIYTNKYISEWCKNFTLCPLWIANYNSIEMPPTGAWSTYDIWQYTSTGDGQLYGNAYGNKYIDLNKTIRPISSYSVKEVITEDEPVVIPEPSDSEKLQLLWAWYKESHK